MHSISIRSRIVLLYLVITNWVPQVSMGFVMSPRSHRHISPPTASQTSRTICSTISTTRTTLFMAAELPDVDSMTVKEMRKELESYGVSTTAMLEKADFVKALKKARSDGLKTINPNETKGDSNVETASSTTDTSSDDAVNGDAASQETPEAKEGSTGSREDRYKKAMEEAKTMKVADLKKELSSRGIATSSFFEKSEFIRAYAEAIADNISKSSSSSSSSGSSAASSKSNKPEEPMDPSYRDVVTQKFDKRRLLGQSVIDVSIR